MVLYTTSAIALVLLCIGIGGVLGNVRCYHCIYYTNSSLPSTKNAPEVCRPHGFQMPMLVESCSYGCVITILYRDESVSRTTPRPPWRRTLPPYAKWRKNETFSVNVDLPPMIFYFRGCAKTPNKDCIMDMSREGLFHQDCFCHSDLCNGESGRVARGSRSRLTTLILFPLLLLLFSVWYAFT